MTEISMQKINLTLKNVFKELIKDGMKGYELIELDDFFALKITNPRYIWLNSIYLGDIKPNSQIINLPSNGLFIRQSEQTYLPNFDEARKRFLPSSIQESFLDYVNDENLKEYFKEQFIVICSPIDYNSNGNPSKSTISKRTSEIRNKIHKLFEEKGLDKSKLTILFTGICANRPVIDENIGEFITCHFLKNKGYFAGHPPVRSGSKCPDAYGFKSDIIEKLKERGFVENGAIIEELSTLRYSGKIGVSSHNKSTNSETIVIEVEPAPNASEGGYKQLRKMRGNYLSLGNFDKGLLVAPFIKGQKRDVNILSFDEDGIEYTECKEVFSNTEAKQKVLKEFEETVKLLLLQNFYFDEIVELVNVKSLTTYQFINKISEIELDKILDVLEQKMKL